MVSSSTSADSRTHRFGVRSLMSALVLISLLLTGMATGTVFASSSDVNSGGGGRYTAQADNGSLSHLQPSSLPSPSPVQTPTSLSTPHADAETQSSTAGSHTVVFDPADGGKAERASVQDGSLASPPADNPKREGYRFDGWSDHEAMMDFRTPVTRDITLKARWTPVNDWVLSPDHGPASGGTSITITPPSADSPSFSTLEAHGDKLIGVTGDGRLYAWTTNDKMPVQVPSPQSKSGEVRFTTGVAGRNGFAALSREHRIYIWSESGETPVLLDADSTTYTSITMAADDLIAVNQEGHIQTWTSKGEPTEKDMSLPKQALAVKAADNADRMLALDSKGRVWTWKLDAIDTSQIQPVKLANRIVQISAMDHGFALLDSTGQTSYLDNRQTQPESLVLPDHSAITAMSSNAAQIAVVDSKGHLWTWKPGKKPTRADDGNQPCMYAASIVGKIIAISRQGSIFVWSLDEQGQPGKPARLNTGTALILESASMDGQALPFSKSNDSWQAEIPTRKPEQAAITITGRQDGQPFTRSLNYTVDQPLTRDAEPRSTLTVRFDTGGGKPEPADQHVSTPYGRVKRPSPDPTREGYQFDGWFIGQVAYDFSRPVDEDLTLTAKWTVSRNGTWSISPDKGSQLGGESTTIIPPDSASRGIRFSQVSGNKNDYSTAFSLAVGSDGNAYAWGDNYRGELGDGTSGSYQNTPVRVKKPDRKTYPDLPEDFTYVQVSAGYHHSLALGSDGNAYAWGDNYSGRLGDGTTTDRYTPVRVKKPDRKMYPDLPEDFTYVQVSAGWQHSLAVGSDGNAYAWGGNYRGQLGDGTTTDRTTPVKVGKPTDFSYVQVSAGYWHSLAVGSDGNAYAWGYNYYGQIGNNTSGSTANPVPARVRDPANPTDMSKRLKATQVSAGYYYSLAVGSDGYVYAWGYNEHGLLGNNSYSNSSFPARVRDPANPTDMSKGLKAIRVSAGGLLSLAVGSDGYAYAWGDNISGQLGDGTLTSKRTPVRVIFPLLSVITGVRFDQTPVSGLTRGDSSSVTVTTPAHVPGTVTVSVDYTMGGAGNTLTDTSLTYTYLPATPAGVLPKAGGEGILLALATGITGMGGVLASRRHRRETL